MKPILFDSGETDFTSNGLGRLSDCTSCVVTEERNGAYELEMEYPITGVHYSDIQDSRIIYAPHDDTKKRQPFRIYKISKPISGIVTVNARHLTYDLSTIPVKPFSASSCVEALQGLKNNALTACPFEFWTDKSVTAKFSTDVPASIRSLLGGQEGSILDAYGTGEYEWDGYTVKLHLHRGADNGVTIRYGKDLTDIESEETSEDTYDGVVPYWVSQDKFVMLSTDPIVWRDGSGKVKAVPLDLSNNWKDAPTEAQLRAAAETYVKGNAVNSIRQNIKIDFVPLWQTEEYKDVAPLQRVKLCDTVTVKHPQLGISATAKVVSTKYNALTERYDEIELGNSKTDLADSITAEIGAATKNLVNRSTMQAAVDYATKLICGGMGGHVVIGVDANGKPNEIIVMDTEDKATAVNVIRLNLNGIGMSTTGYNGPFRTAMTIDSHAVADFIDTGTLTANLIKAGILSDAKGRNSWNMETGELNLNIASTIGGKAIANTESVAAAQASADKAQQTADAAIKSVDVQYAQNQSKTDAPTDGWQTTAPIWKDGYYIWSRTVTTFNSGATSTSDPTCLAGAKGDTGEDGEDAILLMIDSTNGNLFKNSDIATILTVTVITGDLTITDSAALTKHFGSGAHLVWKTKQMGETEWTAVDSASDKLNDNGFLFTISPKDIDTKCQFTCELEV